MDGCEAKHREAAGNDAGIEFFGIEDWSCKGVVYGPLDIIILVTVSIRGYGMKQLVLLQEVWNLTEATHLEV